MNFWDGFTGRFHEVWDYVSGYQCGEAVATIVLCVVSLRLVIKLLSWLDDVCTK